MCERGRARARGVMVYPEGTTFAGDEVRPFRAGAFLAAQRTGAEIVPVGIAYGGQSASFVDEPFAAHYRRMSASPRPGSRWSPERRSGARTRDIDGARELAQARVQELVHRARAALDEA